MNLLHFLRNRNLAWVGIRGNGVVIDEFDLPMSLMLQRRNLVDDLVGYLL